MRTIIFASSKINDYNKVKKYILDSDFIICCDGGLKHAHNINLIPNLIIGDFDSVDQELLSYYKNKGIKIKNFPTVKDYTDAELAIEEMAALDFNEVIIFGGLGNRFDHSLGNVHLLYKCLKKNLNAVLVGDYEEIRIIERHINISGNVGDILSLVPFSKEVTGIYTTGLKYGLNNETLYMGSTRGVSNVFLKKNISVTISSGLLLVISSFE